jgi:hypothetical protein
MPAAPALQGKVPATWTATSRSASTWRHAAGCLCAPICPSRAHDDVVEDPDAEERARPSEPAEDCVIGPARRGIAARMVVRDDETCALARTAALNTSRGCTGAASSVPTDTMWSPRGLWLVASNSVATVSRSRLASSSVKARTAARESVTRPETSNGGTSSRTSRMVTRGQAVIGMGFHPDLNRGVAGP